MIALTRHGLALIGCFSLWNSASAQDAGPEVNHPTLSQNPASTAGAAQDGLAPLAERLLPEVVNVSASSTIRPRSDKQDGSRESGPDSGPDTGPQIPHFAPGSPLDQYFRDYMQRKTAPDSTPREMQAQGSGFILSSDGYIVTNEHVIHNADKISVTLQDGTILPAKIIGRDHRTDIAVIKVKPASPLPAVTVGNSDAARTGDRVMAIGNPFGLSGTVTSGIVSSRSRDIHHGLYNNYIQTDAAINRGNSGGPLFNLAGEVIGINTAIFSTGGGSIGLGFSIPWNDAAPVVQQLIHDGHVTRGWIGVTLQDMTPDIAASLGVKAQLGGLIAAIDPEGPAHHTPLKTGDVITAINGKEVDRGTLARLVAALAPGKEVILTWWRDGRAHTTPIKISTSPEKPDMPPAGTREHGPKNITMSDLGLTVVALDDDVRTSHKISDSQRGVMVASVTPKSIAARRGLKMGDIVLQVQSVDVDSPSAFAHEVDRARDQKKEVILFLVQTDDGIAWVPLPLLKALP